MRKSRNLRQGSKLYQATADPSRKRRNRWIALTLMSIALGIGGYFSFSKFFFPQFKRLSVFEHKKIIIQATEHIAEVEIRKWVGSPSRENIFELNLEKIKQQIKRHSWVLEVNVTRILPHSLRIDIIEKKPVALISLKRLYFLDAFGKKIALVRRGQNVDFPVLSGFTKRELAQGETILDAYKLISNYQENPFLNQWPISEVRWHAKKGFSLFTKQPTFEIRLGHAHFSTKFVRLERVLKDLYQKDVLPTLVDLNFTKKVVVNHAK